MWTWRVLRCRFTSPPKKLRPQEIDDCKCNTAFGIGMFVNLAVQLGRWKRGSKLFQWGNGLRFMDVQAMLVATRPGKRVIRISIRHVLSIVLGYGKMVTIFSCKPRMLYSLSKRDPQQPFCLAYILWTINSQVNIRNMISPVPIRNYDHHLATPDHHLATQHHHHHELH